MLNLFVLTYFYRRSGSAARAQYRTHAHQGQQHSGHNVWSVQAIRTEPSSQHLGRWGQLRRGGG